MDSFQLADNVCNLHVWWWGCSDATHKYVSVAPRSVLRHQLDRAKAMGSYDVNAASELEYYLFETSYRDAVKVGYRQVLCCAVLCCAWLCCSILCTYIESGRDV